MIIQVNRIREALGDIARRKQITSRDPPQILVLTRQLLESQHLQRSFPVVSLYCNWCVHCTITRSTLGFEILRQITEILNCDIANGTLSIDDATEGVSAALRVGELRDQLISLYTKFGIDTWCFENTTFYLFMSAILDAIEEHPIAFPDKRAGKAARVYSEIERLAGDDPRRMVVHFLVTKDLDAERLEFFRVPRGTYTWEVKTAFETRFAGVLYCTV